MYLVFYFSWNGLLLFTIYHVDNLNSR